MSAAERYGDRWFGDGRFRGRFCHGCLFVKEVRIFSILPKSAYPLVQVLCLQNILFTLRINRYRFTPLVLYERLQ